MGPLLLFVSAVCCGLLQEMGVAKVFVINLERRSDRLAQVAAILGELEIPFTRFPAIDARQVLADEGCREDGRFDADILVTRRRFCEICRALPPGRFVGEVGCWLSHLQVYLEIARSGTEHPTLVLEDDVDLDADVKRQLRDALGALPGDWEMFFLGWGAVRESFPAAGPNIGRVDQRLWGAHAYVVRSAAVAQKLVGLSNKSSFQVADRIWIEPVRSGFLKLFAAFPKKLASQCDPVSDIRGETPLTTARPLPNSLRRLLRPYKSRLAH